MMLNYTEAMRAVFKDDAAIHGQCRNCRNIDHTWGIAPDSELFSYENFGAWEQARECLPSAYLCYSIVKKPKTKLPQLTFEECLAAKSVTVEWPNGKQKYTKGAAWNSVEKCAFDLAERRNYPMYITP